MRPGWTLLAYGAGSALAMLQHEWRVLVILGGAAALMAVDWLICQAAKEE